MFHPPVRQSEEAIATIVPRYTHSVRVLDERFIRILKIFKWGPDAEKALEVLMLRVDHWLVREVMKTDIGVNVKMQFFRWAAKRRNYEHDTSTYMALIRCLEVVEQYGEDVEDDPRNATEPHLRCHPNRAFRGSSDAGEC